MNIENQHIKKDLSNKNIKKFNGILNRRSLLSLLKINENQLSKLTKIELNNNNITKIKLKTFDGLSSVKELNISNNQLISIKKGTFDGLSSLEELDISNNQLIITSILPKIFNNLHMLKILNLSHNKLTIIEDGVFIKLHNLKELDLSWNKLTTIKVGAFDGLSSLEKIYFNGIEELDLTNNIQCAKIKPNAHNIRSYNKFFSLFQKIEKLNLSRHKCSYKELLFEMSMNKSTFASFFNILSYVYNTLKDDTYNKYNNINSNKFIINNIWNTSKRKITNNKIHKIKIFDTKKENIIINKNIKKYLIEKSDFIHDIMKDYKNTDKNNNITIQLLNINDEDIQLLGKYLESMNFNDFTHIELIKIKEVVNHLIISDKKLRAKMFLKYFEIMKDYDENQIITFFQFKI